MLDKSATRESFHHRSHSNRRIPRRNIRQTQIQTRHAKTSKPTEYPSISTSKLQSPKANTTTTTPSLTPEASQLLKLYIEDRKRGTRFMPPEELTDDSPLIRNSHIADKVLGVSEKTISKIVHEVAVSTKIAKKLPDSWMYSVRTHSLRKFFRTQMSAVKLDSEIINYMMGHTVDTYEDVQSLGIETLRNMYSSAGLAIRPKDTSKPNRPTQRNHPRLGRKPRRTPDQRCIIAGEHH